MEEKTSGRQSTKGIVLEVNKGVLPVEYNQQYRALLIAHALNN